MSFAFSLAAGVTTSVGNAYFNGSAITAPCTSFYVVVTGATGYTVTLNGMSAANQTFTTSTTSSISVVILDNTVPSVKLNLKLQVLPCLSSRIIMLTFFADRSYIILIFM